LRTPPPPDLSEEQAIARDEPRGARDEASCTAREPPEPDESPASDAEPPIGPPSCSADPSEALRERITELESTVASLRAALDETLAQVSGYHRAVLEKAEPQLVELAITIARRIVGQELATDPSLVVRWAREGIDALAEGEVVVGIGPGLAHRVPLETWAREIPGVNVRVDATLPDEGLEVRTAHGRARACAQARADAIAQALGIEPRGAR
jgi:flagellar assembly protein FliH